MLFRSNASLLKCLGADASEIFDGLNLENEEESKEIDVVLRKIKARFVLEKQTRFRLIHMLQHFVFWQKHVITVHSWMVLFATEL